MPSVTSDITNVNILFIGFGKMASAICQSWLNILPANNIYIFDPFLNKSSLDSRGFNYVQNISNDLSNTKIDYVLLGIKPQNLSDIVPNIHSLPNWQNICYISILAGKTISAITEIFLKEATSGVKSIKVLRTMPNLPALISQGVTGGKFSDEVSLPERKICKVLFEEVGDFIEVEDESSLNKITAISGSGPAYFFRFIELIEEEAKNMGFSDDDAKKLAYRTAKGSIDMLVASDKSAKQLRQDVTSKGGTTEAALNTFTACGLEKSVHKAIQSAIKRAEEL